MSAAPKLKPFVGLRSFESADSMFFFGRDRQVRELLTRLDETHFLAVLGSSGCGKSSLVRAGLIPILQAGFLVEERDAWVLVELKPGDNPSLQLARALISATGGIPDEAAVAALVAELDCDGENAVLKILRPCLEQKEANCLLLVDQLEELFRSQSAAGGTLPRNQARDFVSILLALREQRDVPIYIALTMRSDFLGECSLYNGLAEAMNRSQYLVPRLDRQQRREAITGPLQIVGESISPQLVDRLLNEQSDTHDDLPIIQHVLMRTWDQWIKSGAKGPLEASHYEDAGTAANSLALHAEEALKGLSAADLLLTRQMFQALTRTDEANRCLRCAKHLSELAAITQADQKHILQLIRQFQLPGRSFLIASPGEDPLVDISHESLLRQWPRLAEWVHEEAELVAVGRRLMATAQRHESGYGELLYKMDLRAALVWQSAHPANEFWAVRHGLTLDAINRLIEKSRLEDNLRLRQEQQARLEVAVAGVRASLFAWLRFAIFIIVLVILTATTLVFWKEHEKRKAENQVAVYETKLNDQISNSKQAIEAFNNAQLGVFEMEKEKTNALALSESEKQKRIQAEEEKARADRERQDAEQKKWEALAKAELSLLSLDEFKSAYTNAATLLVSGLALQEQDSIKQLQAFKNYQSESSNFLNQIMEMQKIVSNQSTHPGLFASIFGSSSDNSSLPVILTNISQYGLHISNQLETQAFLLTNRLLLLESTKKGAFTNAYRALSIIGHVSAKSRDGNAEQSVHSGDTISAGWTISTGANSRMALISPDGSIMRIGSETSIILPELSGTNQEIQFINGMIHFFNHSNNLQDLQIRTSNVTARIRG